MYTCVYESAYGPARRETYTRCMAASHTSLSDAIQVDLPGPKHYTSDRYVLIRDKPQLYAYAAIIMMQ